MAKPKKPIHELKPQSQKQRKYLEANPEAFLKQVDSPIGSFSTFRKVGSLSTYLVFSDRLGSFAPDLFLVGSFST